MKLLLIIAIGSLLLTACDIGTPPPPVPIPSKRSELGRLVNDPNIIDIHTHTFNSSFLPIHEIALGKRDKLGRFLSIFAIDPVTNFLTDTVSAITAGREKHLARALRYEDVVAEIRKEEGGEYESLEVAEAYSNPTISGPCKLVLDHESDHALTSRERYHLQQFAASYSEPAGIFSSKDKGSNEIGHFFDCITTPRAQMESRFHSDHGGKIALNASHMMDLAPVYDQKETGRLVPIEKQVSEMQREQELAGGRMLFFAAYNPFRDHWHNDPKSSPDRSLQIVQDAYRNHGAFGVKVYPPSGYSPTGTSIRRIGFAISPQPWRQWGARYRNQGTDVTGKELDERLLKLFRWSANEGVPVFAHSGHGEVEARNGYHNFANPMGWKKLFESNPELRELRLCLAHAGGDSGWFSGGQLTGWGRTVYELCRDYPNVYCEFGCEDSIADPAKRELFTKRLAALIAESSNGPHSWDFSEKILYGSDWFMPVPQTSNRLNYLLAHQTAIYQTGGTSLYRKYFLTNSLEFLNARQRLKKPGLATPLRSNLQRLISHSEG